jgi:hypothetical protein
MVEAEPFTPSPEPPASTSTKTGEVTLTLSDIESGLAALPRARAARFVVLGGALVVIALVVYRWNEGRERTPLIVIGAVFLLLLLMNGNPAKRIAKKVFASLPEESKTIRVRVDEDGFGVTSSGTESRLPWRDVRRCVETREVLVVFITQHDGQILPKRAFSASELESIREWSKTKIVERSASKEPWFTPELRTRMMIWILVFALVWTAFVMFGHR